MSKHTPGPWVWGTWTIHKEDRDAQKRGEPFWTLTEGLKDTLTRGPIGRKAMDTDEIVRPLGWETEGIDASEADMALIAAAPELLESLRECMIALGKMGANTTIGPNRQEWVNARAAIAKAEGR